MPILNVGWEFHIIRESEQDRGAGKPRVRTVGRYQIYHDGIAQTAPHLSGQVAESHGPGANEPEDNGLRVEEGRYPLWTQEGGHYVTWGYILNDDFHRTPKPGLELKGTGKRTEILIHPGHGFLASVGCINPCTSLPDADESIDFVPSRTRVIGIIDDLKSYIDDFPSHNGEPIPNAFVVIDGEP